MIDYLALRNIAPTFVDMLLCEVSNQFRQMSVVIDFNLVMAIPDELEVSHSRCHDDMMLQWRAYICHMYRSHYARDS